MREEIKLIFTGPTGAGKTTAIGSISEFPPVRTEVRATDEVAERKETTTAALDYGQVTLDDGHIVKLFGTPGQERFGYMRKILSRGGLGLIVLVDNSSSDPFEDLEHYLDSFEDFIGETSAVIGVARSDVAAEPTVDAYQAFLDQRGSALPVLFVDPRKRKDVVLLIEVLLNSLEYGSE